MTTTTIQFRADPKDKKAVEAILAQLGLDLPTALRAFLKNIKTTRGIPFKFQLQPEVDENGLTPDQVEAILKASDEAKRGINVSPTFDTAKEAITYLRSQTNED